MQKLLYKTKSGGIPKDKPRVYFTCHPDDFDRTFEKVCEDIFKTHDCAIYYTENMTELLPEKTRALDLERMNLFVVPVTYRLMTSENRANDFDLPFAKERNIAILPLMFETGLDEIYSRPENFGARQYLAPLIHDATEISYEEKLKKFLESMLFDNETAERVRKAFDAYIFLSYRKMDRVYANDLMKLIHSEPRYRDIAIWYDEFLTPGEAFDKEIEKALSLSSLFAMAVTPNLVRYTPDGKPNYVMQTEYPMAKKLAADPEKGKPFGILPVKMVDLNVDEAGVLEKEFTELPDCVNGHNAGELGSALFEQLKEIALTANDDDSEHTYLIGLAYLNGIDVETDPVRGLSLITKAAEAEFPEAMKALADMYHYGDHVKLDYREEAKWHERLYDHYSKTQGKHNRDTLACLNNLAVTCMEMGDLQRAVKLQKKAYTLSCWVMGGEDPETLAAMNNLATTYGSLGYYRRAVKLQEEVYAIRFKTLGEEHPDTLTCLNNLAFAYVNMGDYQRAVKLQEKYYDLSCKVLGEEHSSTLTGLNNLALTYGRQGENQRAAQLNEKAYTLCCKNLGEEHPDTIISLNNLAATYWELGDYQRAVKLNEKAYALFCKVQGDEHPDTLVCLSNLAGVYGRLGENQRAAQLNEKVYGLRCKVLGEEHPDTIISLNNLAAAFSNLGDHQHAAQLMEKVYDLNCRALGTENPNTLISLESLANAYERMGNHERELELKEKLYTLRCKALGEEHPDTLTCLNNLALAYGDIGDNDRQAELMERAYALRCKALGEDHSSTLTSLNNLVYAYNALGNYDRAVKLGNRAAVLFEKKLGSSHRRTLNLLSNLANAYYGQGNTEQALSLCDRIEASGGPLSDGVAKRITDIRKGCDDAAQESKDHSRISAWFKKNIFRSH